MGHEIAERPRIERAFYGRRQAEPISELDSATTPHYTGRITMANAI